MELTAKQLQTIKDAGHFKDIESGPMPENTPIYVFCSNGADQEGFATVNKLYDLGLNALIARSWIAQSEAHVFACFGVKPKADAREVHVEIGVKPDKQTRYSSLILPRGIRIAIVARTIQQYLYHIREVLKDTRPSEQLSKTYVWVHPRRPDEMMIGYRFDEILFADDELKELFEFFRALVSRRM